MGRKLNCMTSITITEKDYNEDNLLYIQANIGELLSHADCSVLEKNTEGRAQLMVNCPECYVRILQEGSISQWIIISRA